MGSRGASDNSEGKEVSDSREKAASDGSEGSEAMECVPASPENIERFALYHNDSIDQVGRLYHKNSVLKVFEF